MSSELAPAPAASACQKHAWDLWWSYAYVVHTFCLPTEVASEQDTSGEQALDSGMAVREFELGRPALDTPSNWVQLQCLQSGARQIREQATPWTTGSS